MTPWLGCRPRRIGPGAQQSVLLWKCLLDGEAYVNNARMFPHTNCIHWAIPEQ